MRAYKSHLLNDKKLARAIHTIGDLKLSTRENVFLWLVRSVLGQQLSTKAAASIFEKFLQALGRKKVNPKNVLALSIEELRSVGCSYAKANYIHNISQFWIDHRLTDTYFHSLSDDEIINLLTQIKGVGKWTVQMLLMFTLGRENIFAVDDLGIQQGMMDIYGWKNISLKELKIKMLKQSLLYSPYNTYACIYIWRWKDG